MLFAPGGLSALVSLRLREQIAEQDALKSRAGLLFYLESSAP